MINIKYPLLNRTMYDTLESKERAIEVLRNVRAHLIDELAVVNSQIEELET
jgi:hypothetical protein